ncbi:hypothetical protein ACW4TU_04065 [Streptomyces sp. QTS52]
MTHAPLVLVGMARASQPLTSLTAYGCRDHVPLLLPTPDLPDDDPFPWIEEVEDFLADLQD